MAAFYRLWKTPPTIRIIVENKEPVKIPSELKLVLQHLPANVETDKPVEIPIPQEILEYISIESDSWAVEARKRRARALYADAKNWDVVKRMLELEDSTLERP